METVSVSVLIPVYNAEKYIDNTLKSIFEQTFQNFEIIIVEDCSTDGSLQKIQKYKDERIKIICNDKNRGIAYSRNKGLANCTGKYIALLDDDDIALNTRLERQISFLEDHDEIDAVGGNAQWIDEHDHIVRDTIDLVKDPCMIRMFLLFRNIFNNSEMTFRRDIVIENNMKYQDHCFGLEDYLFWIEFSKVGKISNISDLVLKKRVRSDNETANMRKNRMEDRKKKYLDFQIYSLALDGFQLEKADEIILANFFAEEAHICRNEGELRCLSEFLIRILKQAENLHKDFYSYMERWFEDLLYWNLENMKINYLEEWKYSIKNTKDKEKKRNVWFTEDLFELISMNRLFWKKEQYIKDLIEAKKWLEQHSKEQEKYIEMLEKRAR